MDLDRALFGRMGRRSAFVTGVFVGIPVGVLLIIALFFSSNDAVT